MIFNNQCSVLSRIEAAAASMTTSFLELPATAYSEFKKITTIIHLDMGTHLYQCSLDDSADVLSPLRDVRVVIIQIRRE